MATTSRPPAAGAPNGQTQLQNNNPPPQTTTAPRQAVLHLRGATREEEAEAAEASGGETRRRIQWAEDVVDNEGLGRKKSKGLFRPFLFYVSAYIPYSIFRRETF
jgi:protein phosphatase 1 regulatory subunit 11